MSSVKVNNIWQYTDFDSSLISILYFDKKLIDNSQLFAGRVKEIERQSKCTITVHGLDNSSSSSSSGGGGGGGAVWIRIESRLEEARREAINAFNQLTNNACKEIVLPKLSANRNRGVKDENDDDVDDDEFYDTKRRNLTQTVSETKHSHKSVNTNIYQQTLSGSSTNSFLMSPSSSSSSSSSSSLSLTTPNPKLRKPLTRSSTENFISSLNETGSSPFGSFLQPLTTTTTFKKPSREIREEEEDEEDEERDYENVAFERSRGVKNFDQSAARRVAASRETTSPVVVVGNSGGGNRISNRNAKKVYNVEFLLARADVESSKKLPANWKELSALYPNICFCGKVSPSLPTLPPRT
jgi:hypothetical protein